MRLASLSSIVSHLSSVLQQYGIFVKRSRIAFIARAAFALSPTRRRCRRGTSEQMSAVMSAAEPLAPTDRDQFLRALADALRNEPGELGDGCSRAND
jgi:hypothetical protein